MEAWSSVKAKPTLGRRDSFEYFGLDGNNLLDSVRASPSEAYQVANLVDGPDDKYNKNNLQSPEQDERFENVLKKYGIENSFYGAIIPVEEKSQKAMANDVVKRYLRSSIDSNSSWTDRLQKDTRLNPQYLVNTQSSFSNYTRDPPGARNYTSDSPEASLISLISDLSPTDR